MKRKRGPGPFAAVTTALIMVLVPSVAVAEDGPSATPQRPSLTFNAATVPDGGAEVELGSSIAAGFGALPVFAKYGLTGALELEAGIDAVRWVDGPDAGSASIGDLLVGARWRVTGDRSRV